MPILKHAIKKLRVDKRRADKNKRTRTKMKSALKSVRLTPDASMLSAAFSAIDRAAKKMVIHKRKADRLKSRLTKSISKATPAAK